MVGVFIVTHSSLATALIESSRMIMGDHIPRCQGLALRLGENMEEFENRFSSLYESLNDGDGVLVLVDLFAGTPSNVAMRNMREKQFECVSGVNLGMLLEVLSSRSNQSLLELKETAIAAGKQTIVDIGEKVRGR